MKLTKRKGFNFFRSYYDVFNELPEEDKLPFIEALLNRQFLGEKPNGLKGLAKFAWISQVNSIDSQVKGYEDKTGVKLTPSQGGVNTPTVGGYDTPSRQVEEKGEEKGEEITTTKSEDVGEFIFDLKSFNDFYNQISKSQAYLEETYMRLKIEKGSISRLLELFKGHLICYEQNHKTFSDYKIHFNNWLNTQDRNEKLTPFKRFKREKGSL